MSCILYFLYLGLHSYPVNHILHWKINYLKPGLSNCIFVLLPSYLGNLVTELYVVIHFLLHFGNHCSKLFWIPMCFFFFEKLYNVLFISVVVMCLDMAPCNFFASHWVNPRNLSSLDNFCLISLKKFSLLLLCFLFLEFLFPGCWTSWNNRTHYFHIFFFLLFPISLIVLPLSGRIPLFSFPTCLFNLKEWLPYFYSQELILLRNLFLCHRYDVLCYIFKDSSRFFPFPAYCLPDFL